MFERYPLFRPGDEVRIIGATFEGFEGRVAEVPSRWGKVIVEIAVFGKDTPIELEPWQIEHRDNG